MTEAAWMQFLKLNRIFIEALTSMNRQYLSLRGVSLGYSIRLCCNKTKHWIIVGYLVFHNTSGFAELPQQSIAPSIALDVGYRVELLANSTYLIVDAYDYTAMFSVTNEGVVLFDAPPTMAEFLAEAIASVTDEPVTHLIYSHAHTDHIGAASLFADANIVAHHAAGSLIPYIHGVKPPTPTIVFQEKLVIHVGSLKIVLEYIGPNHDPGSIFITLPSENIMMAVDIIDGGHVPWFSLNYASHIPGYLAAIDFIMSRDFDYFVAGHVDRAYTREEMGVTRDYVLAVRDAMYEAFDALQPKDFIKGTPGDYLNVDTTAESKRYLDAVVDRCEQAVVPAWENKLGAVKAFTRDHCNAFLQEEIDVGGVSIKR